VLTTKLPDLKVPSFTKVVRSRPFSNGRETS
jgi:hypothetical protein